MFNPAKAAEEIKKEYMGYISTTYHFRDQKLQERLKCELEKTVSKGPFVEIKDTFKTGDSIDGLIKRGVLSPLFKELESDKSFPPKLPVTRKLYKHQENAIEKIVGGKNVVVSTGTGSGKTYCFLIPVINELLRELEVGSLSDGVRAIFIYPMNALANDQIKGLREILMKYDKIKFGVYNGSTEREEAAAINLYESMYANEKYPELRKPLPNEMLSREKMIASPPHILFTNYAMLEHMLFRPKDDALFSGSNFKFVVLDEAHVYLGAKGIETALLMGRLKGRLSDGRTPQFILTSATLGDGKPKSNEMVVEFAKNLTGCEFYQDDIIMAERNEVEEYLSMDQLPPKLYLDLLSDEKNVHDTLIEHNYNINFPSDAKDADIIYDVIIKTDLYAEMRKFGKSRDGLIPLDEFAQLLGISLDVAVAFIALCAKARKNGMPLVDIRYHYFLRALDGAYLAIDFPQSFSLTRKDVYEDITSEKNITAKMFEIGVCEDCGEMAIIGKREGDKFVRIGMGDEMEYYQMVSEKNLDDFENDEIDVTEIITNRKKAKEKKVVDFVLCKSCGAIVEEDESHNKWCKCGDTKPITIKKRHLGKCFNCNGTIRKFNLGYESATSVVATSLFEQIPEKNGNQFLVFSDSRQGAAKFACSLEKLYKEFLRRRAIWNVANEVGGKYKNGINISEFVDRLNNYFSEENIFRGSNAKDAQSTKTENERNAWVAILNELCNSNRSTSLVSLGKMQFEYMGNTDAIIDVLGIEDYKISKADAKNFLNYLALEIVRAGAIITGEKTAIDVSDREYIFFTQAQQFITKNKNKSSKCSKPFLPTTYQKKDGGQSYYRSNKLTLTKAFLKLDDKDAIKFLDKYWEKCLVSENNPYRLQTKDGKGYYVLASSFVVFIGKDATLWQCEECQNVTQFNIGGKCIHQPICNGKLTQLNSEEFCKDNYYAKLYENKKVSPLFVKEHTAQLAKMEALEYQQMFIEKEINALSCSTTFEMGVDVGDLETVFLRNIPPLASNYAQRVGRAGRSIDAAAFALTFARLSSHDFHFFDRPAEMINGVIFPPQFNLKNEKIIKRHIYAVAISLYLNKKPDLYDGNDAKMFITEKGYEGFLDWLEKKPKELKDILEKSIPSDLWNIPRIEIETFGWLDDFCGEHGRFRLLVENFHETIDALNQDLGKAWTEQNIKMVNALKGQLDRYQRKELIDFLVRGNILPKYGFPVDSVELSQNIASVSRNFKSLNLNRDLSIAIAEYAPSAEVVADGWLYTSRYIRKPIVNKSQSRHFDISYIATCTNCEHINYQNTPVREDSQPCVVCGTELRSRDFHESIEPRAGFITEKKVKDVPLSSQERKYKTEAIYIGDKEAGTIGTSEHTIGKTKIKIESTTNDSLVVKSTERFYVCKTCGYSITRDEKNKLKENSDYKSLFRAIEMSKNHDNPFDKGECENKTLKEYDLHHEFRTDVAKITFVETDTSDKETMLSVMYALLNSFANTLSIEKRDIKACLTYKYENGIYAHKIIIYDSVPGGAGHSRRLVIVTEDGPILNTVISNARQLLEDCKCVPSCYRCLRSYENQKIHEILNREKALNFLSNL